MWPLMLIAAGVYVALRARQYQAPPAPPPAAYPQDIGADAWIAWGASLADGSPVMAAPDMPAPAYALTPAEKTPWSFTGAADAAGDLAGDALGAARTVAADLFEAVGNAVTRLWTPPKSAAPYLETIRTAEVRYGLPPGLLARQLHEESRFRPDVITGLTKSSAGALGIAQFMPATARELGVDPLQPADAIDGAARYMAQLFRRFGDWTAALAAYNWGQGNVARRGLANLPEETRNYIANITKDVPL